MDLLKQKRIAFVGIPDAGKSTLISSMIEYLHNKIVTPDTLMNEVHYTNGKDIYGNTDTRTIRAAKILCSYKDYELMLIDCPGHVEYMEQIKQGLDLSSIVVCLLDDNRLNESKAYLSDLEPMLIDKDVLFIHTHSQENTNDSFESNKENSHLALGNILAFTDTHGDFVDIEHEAIAIVKKELSKFKNKYIMFSGGKDSIVGYHICKEAGIMDSRLIYPESGFDFQDVVNFINANYQVVALKNLPEGMNYRDNSVFEIHSAKAEFNRQLERECDVMIINYRASDEGVRSKDHYIKKGEYCHRFSPVFYFSEENIWRYIAKHMLSFPNTYLLGYRSLGDEDVTLPSMLKCNNVEDIIGHIHNHPFEERDGRKAQDTSVNFGMEKLRNKGFF